MEFEEPVPPVAAALRLLGEAADALVAAADAGGLDHFDDTGLVGFAQGFERVRRRLAVVDHAVIAGGEARKLPQALCQSSMRQVLTSALRISRAEAARRVRAAEAVGPRTSMLGETLAPVRPRLAAAQRAGDVSAEHVAIVERALRGVDHRGFDPADLNAGEELLTEHASRFGPEDLRELAQKVVDAIDPDGSVPADEVNQTRRHFHLRPTTDGAWRGEFRLTGALGAKLSALLDPLARPRVQRDGLTALAGSVDSDSDGGSDGASGAGAAKEVDARTRGQRMHDALEEVCDRLLASGDQPAIGGVPAAVVVTIGFDELMRRAGVGRTGDGTLLSARAVLDLAANADVIPAVLDQWGAVLELGRTRRIATPSQTYALIARDGGCSFPGCDRGPQWCERHHILSWIDGGLTDLNNLTLLCAYHHHNFVQRGWTCRINAHGIPEWVPPRWLDRSQTPLINTRVRAALLARRHAQQHRGDPLPGIRPAAPDAESPPLVDEVASAGAPRTSA